MDIPTLETDRLRLRAPELRDFAPYLAMWADERVTTFIGGTPRARDDSWRRFIGIHGLWALMGFGYWIFADRLNDRLIGVGGLASFERGVPELDGFPESGWALTADDWGQGYASEAMHAVLAWADAALPHDETRCIIGPGNHASVGVATKLGYRHIGQNADAIGAVDIFARARG